MPEPRTSHDTESARHLELRRRARRGIVASYIHQVSARHKDGIASPTAPQAQPLETSQGD
jgi:hypothetical protein